MGSLRSFIIKEIRHILRDRQTLIILMMLPVVLVLLLGYAIRTDVEEIRIAVVDLSGDNQSADLIRKLSATPALNPIVVQRYAAGIEHYLRNGEADVILHLPANFAADLARSKADVLIMTDGINANFAQTAESYISNVIQAWQANQAGNGGRRALVGLETRMRFNPTLESQNLFVPGLLALVLTLVSALMTAISIAKEKELGTLELLLVSPLRPLQIVVGKVAPYLILSFINALTVLFVAWVAFDIPIRGNLALLLFAALIYVLVSLALGVLISTGAPDQRSAMIGALLGLLMPTIGLSGFVFPISSMPEWLQPVTNVVPATWFIIIARGIMLKGVGIAVLWKELLILGGMALLLLGISARKFPDRIE